MKIYLKYIYFVLLLSSDILLFYFWIVYVSRPILSPPLSPAINKAGVEVGARGLVFRGWPKGEASCTLIARVCPRFL